MNLHRIIATTFVIAGPILFATMFPGTADASDTPISESALESGNLSEAAAMVTAHLEQEPDDSNAQFELGLIQFLQSIENLGHSFYTYGLRTGRENAILGPSLPILRIPIPVNGEPSELTYEDFRSILATFVDDLMRAEATLARIEKSPVKLRLHFGRYKMDIDRDGAWDEQESLWRLYSAVNRQVARAARDEVESFVIAADTADVFWLRGYCHLLSAFAEFVLAHDFRESFDVAAHAFFSKPATMHPFLRDRRINDDFTEIADWIAMIHTIRWPIESHEKLQSCHAHLLEVIQHSRVTWELITNEMDDDAEWIPSPTQTGVIPNARITDAIVSGWLEFVDEAEAILTGQKLIPFWAESEPTRGVNLHRAFTEPANFDVVLWSSGIAALPYLEEGDLSTPDTWQRFQRIFGGEFIGFAIWFN